MMQLTTPEVLYLQEFLKSCRSSSNFKRTCARTMSDPQLSSFCDQSARAGQMGEARLGRFLGINMQ